MLVRLFVTAVLVVLTMFVVGGHNRFAGPVLVTLTTSHGVHAGDVPLVLLAAAAVTLLWAA